MSQVNLSSREEIAKIDNSNVVGSIDALADQVSHAYQEASKVKFTPKAKINNVVIAGMGGSGLGAHVIKTLYSQELTVPLDIVNNYDLPRYVDEHTLVILASYSGNTEEILSCAQQAEDAHAQIMVISAGGELAKTADAFNHPIYLIKPKFNPSNQPRMAIGYAVFGTIILLSKAGLISVDKQDVGNVIEVIKKVVRQNTVEVDKENSLAKQIAYQVLHQRPIIVAAEHLTGAVHVSANQFNENAKMFADYKVIPEINHHLLEGLKYPETNQKTHTFLFVESHLYHERNQKRMTLTQDVVEDNGISTLGIKLGSPTRLQQVFESITLFAFANFYVCMLEKIDPAPIPFVDWFKEQLK